VAPIRLSVNVDQFSEPCMAASTSAPMTPMAAASVAVAMPRNIDPMTAVISKMTGIRKREFLSFATKLMPVS